MTKIFETSKTNEEEIFRACQEVFLAGGTVAFPTETVYGLGADARNPEAARKIYLAKGRPSDNPLIVHIGRKEQVGELVREIPEKARLLMDAFWPGPLTIVFPKSEAIPKETTGGLATVGIRMPSHPFTNRLLSYLSIPIAAPSANRSGRPSTTSGKHVIEDLDGLVDVIICDSESPIGLESTIIDLTGAVPTLLRPGAVTVKMLEKVIGPVMVDPAITKENIVSHSIVLGHPKAPGMKYRHYAPKAPLTVFYGPEEAVYRKLVSLQGDRVGILTTDEGIDRFTEGTVLSLGSKENPEEIAHSLFDALRTFDEKNVAVIYAEDFSGEGIGEAIMNRLLKAAGGVYKNAEEEN